MIKSIYVSMKINLAIYDVLAAFYLFSGVEHRFVTSPFEARRDLLRSYILKKTNTMFSYFSGQITLNIKC